jgi:hypothetical protein
MDDVAVLLIGIVFFPSELEFIVLEQRIMLLQVNSIEFNSRMWVSSLPLTLTDRPVSFKAAVHHRCVHDPTHCLRDKYLVRPDINKKTRKETIFLPCLVCLLLNRSANK